MDEKTEKNLWDELKLLQAVIDKFDDFSFRIKNWFITIFVGITGYSIIEEKQYPLLLLNLFTIAVFYMYEVTYRTAHASFLERCREIQFFLRDGKELNKKDIGPNLDRYLFPRKKAADGRLMKFYQKIGLSSGRAQKNTTQIKDILRALLTMLFQPRVSLIYLFAFMVNTLLSAVLLKCWITVWLPLLVFIIIVAIGIFISYKQNSSIPDKD